MRVYKTKRGSPGGTATYHKTKIIAAVHTVLQEPEGAVSVEGKDESGREYLVTFDNREVNLLRGFFSRRIKDGLGELLDKWMGVRDASGS